MNSTTGGIKMTGTLNQDWPVFVLLGLVVFFFIYVIIKSNLHKNEGDQSNQGNSQK